jgi:hypothetical protein
VGDLCVHSKGSSLEPEEPFWLLEPEDPDREVAQPLRGIGGLHQHNWLSAIMRM